MTHELKILPEYYLAVTSHLKEFEIRKNDRDYHVGDVLILREWNGEHYTGRTVTKTIKYIFVGTGEYGLSEGYCVLGLGRYER